MEAGCSSNEPERAKPSQLAFRGLGKAVGCAFLAVGVSAWRWRPRSACVCTSYEKSIKNTPVFGVKPLTSVKWRAIHVSSRTKGGWYGD